MISVIIPVYNVEEYIHVCLNSILKQTYQDFEVICIDDASTDSSTDILEYFANKDSRIKIIKNYYTLGRGYCRNQGLDLAKGKYISFLEGKDWLSHDAFEILVEHAKKYNLELLLFNEINFNEEQHDFYIDGDYDVNLINRIENKVFTHFDLTKSDLLDLSHEIWNKFYLKSFLDDNNIRFSDKNLEYENIPFFYKVITSANRISFIGNYLYNCRKIKSSFESNPEKIFDIFTIICDVFDVLMENKQLYQYYKKMFLKRIFSKLEIKYDQIDSQLQERFFIEVRSLYNNLIKYHDIYYDIVDYVNQDTLNKFNFKEVLEKIKNPPKLTIVVPVFNTENYLPRVLDSIVNQTIGLDNIEVIIVDDCSTDKSGDIIDKYSREYESIIAIHLLENSGSPSKPRNIGVRNASSDYIVFQDSDDGFTEYACEWLYDVMIEDDVDLVNGMIAKNGVVEDDYKLSFSPWDLVLKMHEKYYGVDIEELLASDELLKLKLNSIEENPLILKNGALNSIIFKKSFLIKNNIQFQEYLNGGEDAVFLFNSYIKAHGLVFINKLIYYYNVQRMNSLTHNFSFKTIASRPKAYRVMYEYSILNNKKDMYVKNVLLDKISYWFNEYIFKAPELDDELLFSIFKSQQILFSECINYGCNYSNILKNICQDIKDNNFIEAVNKINNYRNTISSL